jgi:hypothetical protein
MMKIQFLIDLGCARWRRNLWTEIAARSDEIYGVEALAKKPESPQVARTALAFHFVRFVQKNALAFRAHLMHRGDLRSVSSFKLDLDVSRSHKSVSSVDKVSFAGGRTQAKHSLAILYRSEEKLPNILGSPKVLDADAAPSFAQRQVYKPVDAATGSLFGPRLSAVYTFVDPSSRQRAGDQNWKCEERSSWRE